MTFNPVPFYWSDGGRGGTGFAPKARNFMRYMFAHPCARPWYVYAETFAPAFIKLFITLTLWDMDDIIRARAGALAYGPGARGRGAGKHLRKPQVHGFEPNHERFAQRGLRTLLKVTAPLEALGFAWLMYAAGDQFFYDWQTLLMQSDFCTAPIESGPFSRSGEVGAMIANPMGNGFSIPDLEQNRGGWGHTGQFVTLPDGIFTATIAVSVSRQGSTIAQGAIGFRYTLHGESRLDIGEIATIRPDSPVQLVHNVQFRVPTTGTLDLVWVLAADSIPTGYYIHSASVVVSRVG